MNRRRDRLDCNRFLLPLGRHDLTRLRDVNHRIEFLTKALDRLKWERTVLMKDVPPYRPRRPRAPIKAVSAQPVQRTLF